MAATIDFNTYVLSTIQLLNLPNDTVKCALNKRKVREVNQLAQSHTAS